MGLHLLVTQSSESRGSRLKMMCEEPEQLSFSECRIIILAG